MTSVNVAAEQVARAARELGLAGRWAAAHELLDAVAADPPSRVTLALAAGEVAMDATWFGHRDLAARRLAEAESACAAVEPGDGDRWDLGYLRGRYAYYRLLHATGEFTFGPAGKDPAAMADLRRHFEDLRDSAPDALRRGWAEMYLGLIADNVYADRDAAPAQYEAALAAARSALGSGNGRTSSGDLLAREALRHLGDHDHDAGDHDLAGARWREAVELGARAGTVVGTLSQQLLLAVLARDIGDAAGATALATEIARWAGALGATRLHARATAFLAGHDPTAGPTSPPDSP
jgi:hypothetical protein